MTQARDQLESNETMDELRQVFEGSCALIPLKIVRDECMKLADDFIPELVEALASEMNPQVSNCLNSHTYFCNVLYARVIGRLLNRWTL